MPVDAAARPGGVEHLGHGRLDALIPHGHWKTATLVAGLTLSDILAPFVLAGPINRAAFETYVAMVLAPTLMPSDVVVMDNLSSHTVSG